MNDITKMGNEELLDAFLGKGFTTAEHQSEIRAELLRRLPSDRPSIRPEEVLLEPDKRAGTRLTHPVTAQPGYCPSHGVKLERISGVMQCRMCPKTAEVHVIVDGSPRNCPRCEHYMSVHSPVSGKCLAEGCICNGVYGERNAPVQRLCLRCGKPWAAHFADAMGGDGAAEVFCDKDSHARRWKTEPISPEPVVSGEGGERPLCKYCNYPISKDGELWVSQSLLAGYGAPYCTGVKSPVHMHEPAAPSQSAQGPAKINLNPGPLHQRIKPEDCRHATITRTIFFQAIDVVDHEGYGCNACGTEFSVSAQGPESDMKARLERAAINPQSVYAGRWPNAVHGPSWISVEERLPVADETTEQGEFVLVAWKPEWRGRKLSNDPEDTTVASPSGIDTCFIPYFLARHYHQATHWQPLEPPGKESVKTEAAQPISRFYPPPRFCSYCGACYVNGERHEPSCDRPGQDSQEVEQLLDEALAQKWRNEVGLSESGSAPALAWLNEKFGIAKGAMVSDSVQIIHTTLNGKHVGSRMVDREGKSWRLSEVLDAYLSESVAAQGQTPDAAQLKIDISNLQFYARMADEHDWEAEGIHKSVVIQTLNEIADRLRGGSPARSASPDLQYVFDALVAGSEALECKCVAGSEDGPCASCQLNHSSAIIKRMHQEPARSGEDVDVWLRKPRIVRMVNIGDIMAMPKPKEQFEFECSPDSTAPAGPQKEK